MKTTIQLFLSLLLSTLPLLLPAQLTLRPQLGIGLTSQTKRFGDDPLRTFDLQIRPRLLLEGGLSAHYPFTEALSASVGLLIHNRGSHQVSKMSRDDYRSKSRLSYSLPYVEIPLGLSMKLPTTTPSWADLGLAWGISMGGSRKLKTITVEAGDRSVDELAERLTTSGSNPDLVRRDVRFYIGGRTQLKDLPVEVGVRASLGLSSVWFDLSTVLRNHALTVFASLPLDMK